MPTPAPNAPFTPCYLFFYGSLQDEDVLRAISGTNSTPKLRDCSIQGYGLKLWSVYPTLVPKADGKVVGKAWWCETETQFAALQRYETKAYTWAFCEIEMGDGEVVKEGRVFVWAGEPESADLTDGVFDLEVWRTNWKPNLFGR